MNKLRKLIILFKTTGLSVDFVRGVTDGIQRIYRRNYIKCHYKIFGTPTTEFFATNEVFWESPNVPKDDKVLYLTFDTEWEKPKNVDVILDVLKEKHVPAAFFLKGKGMAENASYVRRIRSEGHVVGNHTMTHLALTTCTRKEIQRELSECAALYHKLTGETMPKIMRPPYGSYDLLVVKTLHRLGYKTFLWNMHVLDWKKEEPATWEIFKAYLDTDLKNGAIILQHTFSDETAQYIGKYIDYCHAQGYRFASLKGSLSF